MKSLVHPKSEVNYYVLFCGMSLFLPQGMKLIEGRNSHLNLVLSNCLDHKCEFDETMVRYVNHFIHRLETNESTIFYNYEK